MKPSAFANPMKRLATLLGAATLALGACVAHAQGQWPAHPVRIIVPYGPGGAVDVATRKIAQKLTEQTGQSFIVENKPGATGTIGANYVAQAKPDGYTLVANDTTYSLLPYIFKKLPFDPDRDLQPVAAFLFAPMALAVNADSPYKSLGDLLAKAKAAPGTVKFGSGGPGTTPHFAAEALAIAANVKFMHVPFKGAAEATQALLGHVIDFQFASTTGIMGPVQGGNLRLLAISGDKPLAVLPNVPTFAQAGVKNFNGVVNWTGLWAPKGTPPAVMQRLQSEIAKAMSAADVQAFARKMGADPRYVDSKDFAHMLGDSSAMWAKVAHAIAFEKR